MDIAYERNKTPALDCPHRIAGNCRTAICVVGNSYRMARESLRMKADEVFRESSMEEMFCRVSDYKKQAFGDKDATLSIKFEVDTSYSVMKGMPNKWLMSGIHTAMQDYIYSEIHLDVSFQHSIPSLRTSLTRLAFMLRWLRASLIPRGRYFGYLKGRNCTGTASSRPTH